MSGDSRPRPEGTGVADSDDSSAGTDGVREDRFRRWRHLSIRARLTATYAGLVTISGTVLIILVYFYTRYITLSIAFGPPQQVPAIDLTTPQVAQVDTNLFELLGAILRSAVGALLLLAVVSGTVGWVLAGRMLRPLSSMNAAAKRAASGDLSQRLALSGPRDEIHDLADTFDTMLASLERSFSVHRRFAANASHELRTPLATTQTMIDVVLSDPDASAEDLRRVLTRVLETNRANRETIDALLDLADAQSGKLAHEDVDMEATVRDALGIIAPEVAEYDLHVSTHLLPARVPGDPVLLRQSVSNLLRNAARYNTEGGRITVDMTRLNDGLRLTIRNDGPLVAAESVESLREPFVRGEGRGRTRGSGHGLGLAIVTAVATAHGGSLRLSANPAGGLTAVLELPGGEEGSAEPL
ncbi:cell wall metabolism sensor histidine kinase WalK [Actinomyces sp. oral taxon 170]|uniref:sensor histidine kinase n=1 Tax=Actinomyces sp. oral taxon 170 TaxID=712117 RepID=UPI000205DEC9|nr:HAMP domain-containing sensor histidine kinase [Actinomyces sp. oral taxon 170]EGF55794.1 ATPase/histidine kinase/DNA gyrase B/HSP90 domain protein [Actinomyces sp. oral taxon 170 str. F0386]